METLYIVLGVILIGGLVYFLTKKKSNKEVVVETKKEDTAPVSKDIEIVTSKTGVIEISKDLLKYEDIDKDIITHVKYYNFTLPLYKDKKLKDKYQEGEELDINTILYVKLNKNSIFSTSYSVKSKDKWSDGI